MIPGSKRWMLALGVAWTLSGTHPAHAADSLGTLRAPDDVRFVPAVPAGAGAPSPAEIATLRQVVERHRVRVRLGEDSYDVLRPSFDAGGIGFTPGDLRRIVKLDSLGFMDEGSRSPLPVSPIPWKRIDGVSVRKPCGLRGVAVGGLVGLGATIALASTMDLSHADSPGAILFAAPLLLGPLAGGAVGSMIFRSEPGWRRTSAAGISPAAPFAPTDSTVADVRPESSAAVKGLPLGVIRDQVADRAVRIWTGPDRLELRRARIGERGVAFDGGDVRSRRSGALDGPSRGVDRASYSATHIDWDRIHRLEVRSRSTERGAVIGMVALTTFVLASSPRSSNAPGDRAYSVGGALLVGIPVGAAAGAGIGYLVPHWRTVWRQPGTDPRTGR